MRLKLTYRPINGNKAPSELVALLKAKLNKFPALSEVNPHQDIFWVLKPLMLKHQDSWGDSANRKAWSMAAHLALASLESSFNWNQGRDMSASNTTPQTEEAGIFQCSLNSIYSAQLVDPAAAAELKRLFTRHTALPYSQSNEAGKAFIVQSKVDHDFAVHFMLLLSRILVRTHGPLLRRTINKFVKYDVVKELETYFRSVAPTEPVDNGLPVVTAPPVPKSRAEIYRIFGNPEERNWSRNNLALCVVSDKLTEFPLVNQDGKKVRGFYCHKLLVPSFQAVFADIVKQCLWDKELYSFEGCYNLRTISGSNNLSFHSWGIAIDLNYEGNELGDSTPAMDPRIVKIFNKHRFFWGGNYRGRKDGMHFEYFSYT